MNRLRQLINRDTFPHWLNEAGLVGEGVEIGTYRGEYAEHLLTHWAGKHLTCIDPWRALPQEDYLDGCTLDHSSMQPLSMDEIYEDAARRLMKFDPRVGLLAKRSDEVAMPDESLDFAYIDGNHDYAHVAEDIRLWWPRIKSGGVLGGHDFYTRDDHLQRADVLNAVWDFAESISIRPHVTSCTSWWFIKP